MLEHPFELVTVTVYVPAEFTVMQLVVAPVLHKYVLPVTAGTHSCVEPPGQIMLLPDIKQTGPCLITTFLLQELEHPVELVTVTVYVPAALTVMQLVVAPVLHK